jgi:N-ethylmaleimide reductase
MEIQTKLNLFEPLISSGLELKNRIVMAPMTRSRAIGAEPNELMAKYYSQRASAGLIISEGTAPSPNGLGYARIPGIFTDEQTEGWKKVTAAVHRNGGKIFIQLMHTGRIAHPSNMPENAEILAPSSIRAAGNMWTDVLGMQAHPEPKSMSTTDIQNVVKEFSMAAKNAIQAGFDGVEIHGANGYLLEQFLNPHINKRTDEYGGSISHRNRFVLEVVDSIIHAIGKEKVGIRLSPYSKFNDMPAYDETSHTYETLAKELNKRDILYLHIIASSARENGEGKRLLKSMRDHFDNLWMVNGGYTRQKAEDTLETGRADLISFGSPFISNPDFPERIKREILLTPPDPATFYSSGDKGYTDYPSITNK